MEFKSYQHIERLGTSEVDGIEFGECYVFPKIDGTNSQLWWTVGEDGIGQLHGGSRNRELTIEEDNQGFFMWCCAEYGEVIAPFFRENPTMRLFGEWLVPHTLKTYSEDAWRRFYVFDVMEDDTYVHYEQYKILLDKFGIEYIPPICKINNPSRDELIALLDANTYLIKDGAGAGEGLVIKNYGYKNKYGRTTWAKIVRNEFRAKHAKVETIDKAAKKSVELEIVERFVTKPLVEKEYAKIVSECDGWSSKYIPRLLNTVYYCLIKEESWNFVKEFKHPTVDFKRLSGFTTGKIKELMPELF